MADLFVSYAREDREGATALVAALTEAGWSVFYDEHLQTGSHWIKELERELRGARCLVILLSAAASDSTWIHEERLFAESIGLSVFPVKLDSSPLPLGFATRHAASLPDWQGGTNDPAFLSFVEKLERQCVPSKRPAPSPTASPAPPPEPPPELPPAAPAAVSPTVAPRWRRILKTVGPGLLTYFLFTFVIGAIQVVWRELSHPSAEAVPLVVVGTLMGIGAGVWLFRRLARTLDRLRRGTTSID